MCMARAMEAKKKIGNTRSMAGEAHNNAKDYMQCCWACEWFISSVRFHPNLIENSNISRIIQNKPNIVHCAHARSSLVIAFNTAYSLEMLNPSSVVNGLTLTIGLKSVSSGRVCVCARALDQFQCNGMTTTVINTKTLILAILVGLRAKAPTHMRPWVRHDRWKYGFTILNWYVKTIQIKCIN